MQWRVHQHGAGAQGGDVRVHLGLELQTQHCPAQTVEASRLCPRQESCAAPRQGGEGEGTLDHQGGGHLPYHQRHLLDHRSRYWNLDQTQHCQNRALTCSRLAFFPY